MMVYFIDHGVALDLPELANNTSPMMMAAREGYFDTFAMLYKRGANGTRVDKVGMTALHYAVNAVMSEKNSNNNKKKKIKKEYEIETNNDNHANSVGGSSGGSLFDGFRNMLLQHKAFIESDLVNKARDKDGRTILQVTVWCWACRMCCVAVLLCCCVSFGRVCEEWCGATWFVVV